MQRRILSPGDHAGIYFIPYHGTDRVLLVRRTSAARRPCGRHLVAARRRSEAIHQEAVSSEPSGGRCSPSPGAASPTTQVRAGVTGTDRTAGTCAPRGMERSPLSSAGRATSWPHARRQTAVRPAAAVSVTAPLSPKTRATGEKWPNLMQQRTFRNENVHQMNKCGATLLKQRNLQAANEQRDPVLSARRSNYTEKLEHLRRFASNIAQTACKKSTTSLKWNSSRENIDWEPPTSSLPQLREASNALFWNRYQNGAHINTEPDLDNCNNSSSYPTY